MVHNSLSSLVKWRAWPEFDPSFEYAFLEIYDPVIWSCWFWIVCAFTFEMIWVVCHVFGRNGLIRRSQIFTIKYIQNRKAFNRIERKYGKTQIVERKMVILCKIAINQYQTLLKCLNEIILFVLCAWHKNIYITLDSIY